MALTAVTWDIASTPSAIADFFVPDAATASISVVNDKMRITRTAAGSAPTNFRGAYCNATVNAHQIIITGAYRNSYDATVLHFGVETPADNYQPNPGMGWGIRGSTNYRFLDGSGTAYDGTHVTGEELHDINARLFAGYQQLYVNNIGSGASGTTEHVMPHVRNTGLYAGIGASHDADGQYLEIASITIIGHFAVDPATSCPNATSITPLETDGVPKNIIVGDSWSSEGDDCGRESWPVFLENSEEREVLNFAVGGTTVTDMQTSWYTDLIPAYTFETGSCISIMGGGNDSLVSGETDATVIRDRLIVLYNRASSLLGGIANVHVLTYPPMSVWDTLYAGVRAALNGYIETQEGVTVGTVTDLDDATGTAAPLQDTDESLIDGTHPKLRACRTASLVYNETTGWPLRLGYPVAGGNTDDGVGSVAANMLTLGRYPVDNAGAGVTLRVYATGVGNIKIVAYDDDDGSVGANAAYAVITSTGAGWYSVDVTGVSLSSGYVWLGAISDNGIVGIEDWSGLTNASTTDYTYATFTGQDTPTGTSAGSNTGPVVQLWTTDETAVVPLTVNGYVGGVVASGNISVPTVTPVVPLTVNAYVGGVVASGDISIQATEDKRVYVDTYAGSITRGSTENSISVFLRDNNGAAVTGLVADDLTFVYRTAGHAPTVADLSDLTDVYDEFYAGGFVEIDRELSPGEYRVDIPNGAVLLQSPLVLTITGDGVAVCHAVVKVTALPAYIEGAVTVDSTSRTTFVSDVIRDATRQLAGAWVLFKSGTLSGSAVQIVRHSSDGTFVVNPLLGTPSAGDHFVVINQ